MVDDLIHLASFHIASKNHALADISFFLYLEIPGGEIKHESRSRARGLTAATVYARKMEDEKMSVMRSGLG